MPDFLKWTAYVIALILAAVAWRFVGWWAALPVLLLSAWLLTELEKAMVTRTDPIPAAPDGVYRIACVGDSITYGTFVDDRPDHCYPAVLQTMVGQQVVVRNFGVPGATMSPIGDMPYRKYPAFRLATEFAPQVVILMLGTNDSKRQNWLGETKFYQYAKAMVIHFMELPSKPTLFLATPPAAFLLPGKKKLNYGMQQKPMDDMAVEIRKLAAEFSLALIDLRTLAADFPQGFSFDGLHTNAAGAKFIAERMHEVVGPFVLRDQPKWQAAITAKTKS